jgi:hypothetical protein
MNPRATVLTLSTALALIAPATQAAAGSTPACAAHANDTTARHNSVLSRQSSRTLQYLPLDGAATASLPAKATCSATKIRSLIAHNRYRVRP